MNEIAKGQKGLERALTLSDDSCLDRLRLNRDEGPALSRLKILQGGASGHRADDNNLSEIYLDSMLNLVRHSILIVDNELSIIWLNNAARRMLDEGDIIRRVGNRIRAADTLESARLKQLVRMTSRTVRQRLDMVMPLRCTRSGRFCEVIACSARQKDLLATTRNLPAVVLMVCEPDRRNSVPSSILESLFRLTRCERKLAEALLNGQGLYDYADEVQISVNTARTHLKSIFRKTDTSSQAALVTLLSRLVPPLEIEHDEP